MVYQPGWLNFWLSRGISLFFFNYAGYGRSTGKPSPSRIAHDGESVIRYLKSKGITQIGVYGRSIGGVTGCHLARHHPDVVQLLIADRTMSTLENAARYLYGAWASSGIKLTAMMADNVDNFLQVRAYKLLIVDPNDTMIVDLAALRTAVAMHVLEQMTPEERFVVGDDVLVNVAEIWQFFAALFAICESDDDFSMDSSETRQARQLTFLRDESRTDFRLKVSESGSTQTTSAGGLSKERPVGVPWLEDNAMLVRSIMTSHCDQLRSALDIVGEGLEGGGVTLNDALTDNPNCPCLALQCTLANLQVWGTLGEHSEDGELGADMQAADRDIEQFLRKDTDGEYRMPTRLSMQRLVELGRSLSPEMLTTYHRRFARARVGNVRREFRRRLSALQNALTQTAGCNSTSSGASGSSGAGVGDTQAGENAERLLRTVLHHLTAVESFVSNLSRFFKSVDLAVPYSRQQGHGVETPNAMDEVTALSSESSDEKILEGLKGSGAVPQPQIDHATSGYIMHVDCGHNGLLDEVELRQLSLHLRAAGFGRTPNEGLVL
jgi:pimeloyl-ACP methyl ester carboxylesterase